MPFDPDAYLKQAPNGKSFDPDTYLQGKPQKPTTPEGWHVNVPGLFSLAAPAAGLVYSATQAADVATGDKSLGQAARESYAGVTTPLLSAPDVDVDKLPDYPLMGPSNPRLMAHAWNATHQLLEGFESPAAIATMGIGGGLATEAKAGSVAAARLLKGMSGAFAGMAGYAATKYAPETWKLLHDPNASFDEKAKAVVDEVGNVVMTLGGVLGVLHKVAPKAAAAIQDKAVQEVPPILQEQLATAKTPEERAAITQAMEQVQPVAAVHELPPPPEPVAEPPPDPKAKGVQVEEAPPEPPAPPVEAKGEAATESLVGIKNEAVDEEMRKMGLEPAEHGPGLSWNEAKADADAKLAADPLAGEKLVQALKDKPRPITGQEDALLLTEVNRQRIRRDAAETKFDEAERANDPVKKAEATVEIAAARDAFRDAQEVATQVGTPQAQGLALRRMMMREDYSLASMERELAAETKTGEITPEQSEQVKELAKRIRETGNAADKHAAARLKAFKTRTAKSTEELTAKTTARDTSKKPKPPPIDLDPEGELLKAAHERAKQEFQKMVLEERIKNRAFYEKGFNGLVKWRRGFLLSSPVTLAKLTAAATWRLGLTALEEGVGTALSKVPGLSKVAAKAPRYGAANSEAAGKAIASIFTQGMRDSWDILRTGKSNLDSIYGKGKDPAVREYDITPRSVIDFFGQLHGALKAPVKRAEFTLSLSKRLAYAGRNGVDTTNPMVQTRLALEAYKDANRAIFLQDNMVTDWFKRGASVFENVPREPDTLKHVGAQAAQTAIKTAFPIVKVPTNIVGEAFEHVTGLATGSARLAFAFRAGIENLPAAQADLIMRNFQKGGIGAAALLLGYFAADKVGGFYQPGERRSAEDTRPGNVKVFDTTIPTFLLHHPAIEALQLGATIKRVQDTKVRKRDQDTQGAAAATWAAALGLIEEEPFARGMVEYAKFFGTPAERQAETGQVVKDLVVPQGVQAIANATDKDAQGNPIKRNPSSVGEAVESGIPGLRQTLPARNPRRSYR